MEFTDGNLQIDVDYCRASSIKRFFNYIIDFVVFYTGLLGVIIVVWLLKLDFAFGIDELTLRLTLLLFYAVVMFATEGLFNGKSLGKLITKTRAVNANGSKMSLQKAFGRNMVRAIPFIAFSALNKPCNPWHDGWSDTIVIEEKKVALYKQKVALLEAVKNQTL